MADSYFDKEGRVLHASNSTDVNAVVAGSIKRSNDASRSDSIKRSNEAPRGAHGTSNSSSTPQSFTSAYEQLEDPDDDTDVNAVKFRDGQRRKVNVSNRASGSFSRGRGQQRGQHARGAFSSSSRPPASTTSTTSSQPKVCSYHVKFGDQALKCESWCMLYSQHQSKAPKARPTNTRM